MPLSAILLAVLVTASSLDAADMFSRPTENDIPALIQGLGDPNVQLGASRALTLLKKASVAPLQTALDSESSEVRIWAAYTLGRIGHEAAVTVPRLAMTLSKATDPHERGTAARSLGQIATAKTAAKPIAVKALAGGLSDRDERVRLRSATSLGDLGPDAKEAVTALVKSFADEPVREAALAAVTRIGKVAIPELVAALNDNTLRLDAATALRKIDSKSAREVGVDRPSREDVPALRLALLNDARDEKARIEATQQLGEIGIAGAPVLIETFSNSSEVVARAAAAAFQKVGPEAVELLADTVKSESAIVRAKAADALGAIGPAAKPAVPILVSAMSDPDRAVQHRAVVALGSLGESASGAVPALIEVMQNSKVLEPTRQLALKVLVRAASVDQRDIVLAALEESSKDGNFGVSSLAGYSLKELKTKAESTSP